MSALVFYQDQATRAEAEAAAATLDNVRDRCERSAAAWNQMADRARRTDAMRAEREGAKTPAALPADLVAE